MRTVSETLFEEYCVCRALIYERIDEGNDQTPDYRLEIGDVFLIVEVKQFEATNSEAAKLQALKEGELLILDVRPGARVRNKIGSAAPQLQKHAQGKHPAMIVLYNNRPFMLGNPASDYEVRIGMYGLETIVWNPGNRFEPPRVIDKRFGPMRKLTMEHNTTISAVAVLEKNDNELSLTVYHNVHAAIPLPFGLLGRSGAKEFRLSERQPGNFQTWEEVHGS